MAPPLCYKQVTQLETFMLKNQTLKAHEKKLQQQLQQKKEMGKAEYEVEQDVVYYMSIDGHSIL